MGRTYFILFLLGAVAVLYAIMYFYVVEGASRRLSRTTLDELVASRIRCRKWGTVWTVLVFLINLFVVFRQENVSWWIPFAMLLWCLGLSPGHGVDL